MSQTSANEPSATENKTEETKKEHATLVDAVFDIGLTWASYGLKVAKNALEQSGKTLELTAKTLERLADELGKKEAEKEDEKRAA